MGTLLVGALAGLLYLDSFTGSAAPFLFLIALVAAVRCSQELVWLLAERNLAPIRGVTYGGVALVVASNWIVPLRQGAGRVSGGPAEGLAWPLVALGVVVLVLFAAEASRYQSPGSATESLSSGLLVVVYVGVLASFAVQLRWVDGANLGILALVSLVATTKCGDVGAYTAGRLFGRRPLAPVLSPKKTVEGSVGGVIGSLAGAWVVLQVVPAHWFSMKPGPWPTTLLFGLAVGVTAQCGDLAESLLKRDLGKKDSSPLLLGLGGALDLLDSILFAAPVAYLFWAFRLVWPVEI
jgi:phosphatidate cytidylyltransferase